MENRSTSTENMYILNEPKTCERAWKEDKKGKMEGKAVGMLKI